MTGPENRDVGAYTLLPDFESNALNLGLQRWSVPYPPPSVTYNPSDIPAANGTETFPPHSIAVHPGDSSLVIVGWRSPVNGRVGITGSVRSLNPAWSDGVRWFVDKGTTNLASGVIPNGGAQDLRDGAGSRNLTSVQVNQGDFLYFIVHRNGNYYCDNTGLRVSIFAPSSYNFLPMVCGGLQSPTVGRFHEPGQRLAYLGGRHL